MNRHLMEPLHLLFDDQIRQLWLWNGTTIAITPNVKVIFLMDASCVSQLGVDTLPGIGKVCPSLCCKAI